MQSLSGGQQQRVSIARALIHDPDVIFADEPTGNLDSENSTNVLKLLKQLTKDHGKTVVMVTHDAEAIAYADRVITIRDGLIHSDQMRT